MTAHSLIKRRAALLGLASLSLAGVATSQTSVAPRTSQDGEQPRSGGRGADAPEKNTTSNAGGGPRGNQQPAETISHAQVQSFPLGSSGKGEPWQIHLALPRGPVPKEGAAALYLLDGNATFPLAWHAIERLKQAQPELAAELDALVLVGIGYPSGLRIDTPRRYQDFTSYTAEEFRRARGAELETGGRDQFRTFIGQELRHAVGQKTPLNPQAQSLLGHSMGGQFAMHMLYREPQRFQNFIAGDPSFWWNGGSLLEEQAAFIAGVCAAGGRLSPGKRLLTENSGTPSPNRPNPTIALAKLEGLSIWHRQQAQASHGSMLGPLVEDGVLFALGRLPATAQQRQTSPATV
ncbi:alpha/beta hydrolase [Lampropedia puyangensis]|nr:alpha/beta hydrolase-fold protein [Lampropedia puyangensis]